MVNCDIMVIWSHSSYNCFYFLLYKLYLDHGSTIDVLKIALFFEESLITGPYGPLIIKILITLQPPTFAASPTC